MKILISPAKMMSLSHEKSWLKNTNPKFIEFSQVLIDRMQEFSPKDIQDLMHINVDLAETNYERFQNWRAKPSAKNALNAILAFKGEVYRGIDAETLSEEAQNYLQNNLFILSGLYGLLKPSDKIMLYRLEMGTKLKTSDANDLYAYWKETLTPFFNSQLKKDEIILNLSSNEYSKVLNKKNLKGRWIEVTFLDYKDGKLKPIMMYFKHARGEMARFCANENIQTIEDLKNFNAGGYVFEPKLSDELKLTFTR